MEPGICLEASSSPHDEVSILNPGSYVLDHRSCFLGHSHGPWNLLRSFNLTDETFYIRVFR